MKIFNAIIIIFLYLISLCSIYYLHTLYFNVDVVLYSALFDALLACVIVFFLLYYNKKFEIYNSFEKIQLIAICILIGYCSAISIPTVIDRSLSFYILQKIDQRGGIRLSQFEEVFTVEYAKEHRLVDVRLTEQYESGTIFIEDGCVKLTERGKKLAAFSVFFRKNILPKHRLLAGKYTDALTIPFKNDNQALFYQCN
jgi:hypothetical protein